MAHASLDGRKVTYAEIGSGTPVVLVHGSFTTSSAWKRVIGSLDVHTHHALTPELPGWGDSDTVPDDILDVAQYQAAAVESVVKQAAVGPIHLVAHSYGAVIALTIALAGRVAIRSLTLLEPLPLGLLTQTGDDDASAEVARFVREYRTAFQTGDKFAARHVVDLWDGAGAFDAMSPAVRATVAAGTAQNIRDWDGNLGFRPSPEACGTIHIPSTIAVGERANPIARLVSRRLRDVLPLSRLIEIPDAGHFMIHTHSQGVARLIVQDVADNSMSG